MENVMAPAVIDMMKNRPRGIYGMIVTFYKRTALLRTVSDK